MFQHQSYLLLDEVQSGCGLSGKFWMHEHFDLREPPDLVTFAKKMLTGGFYYSDQLRPTEVSARLDQGFSIGALSPPRGVLLISCIYGALKGYRGRWKILYINDR